MNFDLKPHAKFQNPMIAPSGRKVTGEREEQRKGEKKEPLIGDNSLRDSACMPLRTKEDRRALSRRDF